MKVCQRLTAGYNTNGNKRAIWVVYEMPMLPEYEGGYAPSKIATVIDEYYSKPDACKDMPELPELQVLTQQYSALRKQYRKKGK